MKYAVSSCLLGENCKYSGGNNKNEELFAFLADKEVISICPEVLGGLPTPRACAEIQGDRVVNTEGSDVSEAFRNGAEEAIRIIRESGADLVITQPRSPSCGKGIIYDGSFTGTLIKGNGIFVQLLEQSGITVKTCEEFLKGEHK